jgi:DNA topoisomerase-1
MNLIIVESPSKAKTIEKYLKEISPAGGFIVRASVGHVRDLPKSNKKAIDIPAGFVPHYEITKGREKVIEELANLAEKSDEVFLATDPDREGEAISWHIKELLEKRNGNPSSKAGNKIHFARVAFYEITKEAIKEAISHPRSIDVNLVKAQEARRVLDRLVGYDLSGLIWKKIRYGLSAGRVQSPALRLICEREREIRAFIPEEFWIISGDFETQSGEKLTLICVEEPGNEEDADRIIQAAKSVDWTVKDITESEAKRSPRPPFTTSTLQQTASSRLGYSPKRTMIVAQKLYEAGHITYMRTDSTTLSSQAVGAISAYVNKKFGNTYLQNRTYKTKVKNAQEAHEAIRPTQIDKPAAGLTPEQKNLYKLIWQRTIASQMSDARLMRTKIIGECGVTPDFATTGSRVVFDGWLKADPEARGDDVELPRVTGGEPLKLVDVHGTQKFTQPPSRYSEAGLVKALEERGIGRPSTYASIISTLEDRGYVEKDGRALKPTDTGEVVSQFLEDNFTSYISDTFTAEMENELDEIAAGERDYVKTLSDFYGPFSTDVKSKESMKKQTTFGEADARHKCPTCGSAMLVKLGRGGKFLSCSTYPDCQGALTIDGVEINTDKPIGNHPDTGEPIYVKTGRFGPYLQLGEKVKGSKNKPRMASLPKDIDLTDVPLEMALKYLSIPRTLGNHPETGAPVIANNGRFGPYISHNGEFRSIKSPDDVYTIQLPRALELLAQEKKSRFHKKNN